MLVNLARGTVVEFMLVMCRNRIAEHQRVNDPDCTWLHCLPPPPIDFQNGAVHHANCHRVGGPSTLANSLRPQGNYLVHMFVSRPLQAGVPRGVRGKISKRGKTKKVAALSLPGEKQRGLRARTSGLVARLKRAFLTSASMPLRL